MSQTRLLPVSHSRRFLSVLCSVTMTLASELIGGWSVSVGHLSVPEAALDAEAQCLKVH